MSRALLAFSFLLAAGSAWAAPAGDPQDLKDRWARLVRQSQEADARGERARAGALRAEAYSIQAEIYWADGNETKARESFAEARKRGWQGSPPWVSQPSRREEVRAQDLEQEEPTPIERIRSRPRPRPTPEDYDWASSPYHHSRASVWHSLLGTPAFEEAPVMPVGIWRAQMWTEVLTSDFSADALGGTTRWNATLVRESVQVDYTIEDHTLLGMRLRAGQLFEVDDQLVRIFENGTQIVPTERGTFDIDSLVLRAKYASRVKIGEAGFLMELKVPLANEANLLTSQTFDLALVGLFSKRIDDFAVHGNLGLVVPIGTPKLFDAEFDEVNTYATGGIGMGWSASDWLNLGAQIEANSSAFRGISALSRNVFTFTTRARVKFASFAVGRGLNESSGGWLLSGGVEVTF